MGLCAASPWPRASSLLLLQPGARWELGAAFPWAGGEVVLILEALERKKRASGKEKVCDFLSSVPVCLYIKFQNSKVVFWDCSTAPSAGRVLAGMVAGWVEAGGASCPVPPLQQPQGAQHSALLTSPGLLGSNSKNLNIDLFPPSHHLALLNS